MSFILVPIVQPATQVVYGTGGGITSSSDMTFIPGSTTGDPLLSTLSVPAIVAQQLVAPDNTELTLATPDDATGATSTVNIRAGNSAGGSFTGGVSIYAGDATGDQGGLLQVDSANPGVIGGYVRQRGGENGAEMFVNGGTPTVGGSIEMNSGAVGGSVGAALSLSGSSALVSGRASLTAGNSVEGSAGGEVTADPASGLIGGDLLLTAGANPDFSGAGASISMRGGGTGGAFGGDLTVAPGIGGTANGVLNVNNVGAANNGQVVTVGNVGPGGAGVAIQGWIAVTVDGVPGYIPHFA